MTKKTPYIAQEKRASKDLAAVDRIIQEEIELIERFNNNDSSVKSPSVAVEDKVVEAVCVKIRQSEDAPFYTDAFALLESLVRRLVPEIEGAKRVFLRVSDLLWSLNVESGKDPYGPFGKSLDLLALDNVAEEYFYDVLSKDIVSDNPIETLDKAQARLDSTDDRYLKKALERIKLEADATIEWRAELNAKQAKLSSCDTPTTDSARKEKPAAADDEQRHYEPHPDMTLDRAIFLLNMLVPGFANKAGNAKKAEFLRFVTGLGKANSDRPRQHFTYISRKESASPQAFKEDLKVIKRWFATLDLQPHFDEYGDKIK